MKLEVFDQGNLVARAGAAIIAADARAAIAARGRFALAVSGGHTPWIMLRALAVEDIPWRVCMYSKSMSEWLCVFRISAVDNDIEAAK
jgi:6-phosphogluconolactonase/glucosamine-6-phosphate isomerase/deaminase